MNRVAVFAHFDAKNIIKDYVIYYLKELKKIADTIIFVSDCNLPKQELSKIKNIVSFAIAKKHGEYDFGSYKIGYMYAKENNMLNDCDELIFVNDSCYGPLYPFTKVWEQCDNLGDFWGINLNNDNFPMHIQSFFIVFKANVFNTEVFDNFITNIKKENTKNDVIIKYEVGLSQLLIKNSFKFGTLFDETIMMNNINSDFIYNKNINPFIKVSSLNKNSYFFIKNLCVRVFKNSEIQYPLYLILESIKENKGLKYILSDINVLRKFIIKIHFKKREIYLFDKCYHF